MGDPASIRYKNPGAMWNGTRATKYGSTHYVVLPDGNHIAVFPTFVQGAAAQFDLWASNYAGMSLAAAIDKWSGHNSPDSYVNFLEDNTGVSINTRVTRALLDSPVGWKLLKAQSRWEAGKPYPMTDAEWQQAQAMAFSGAPQPEADLPFLKIGAQGDDVAAMQGLLNQRGAGPVNVDGRFGKQTRDALMDFQRKSGLRDDGICGDLTWAALKQS